MKTGETIFFLVGVWIIDIVCILKNSCETALNGDCCLICSQKPVKVKFGLEPNRVIASLYGMSNGIDEKVPFSRLGFKSCH